MSQQSCDPQVADQAATRLRRAALGRTGRVRRDAVAVTAALTMALTAGLAGCSSDDDGKKASAKVSNPVEPVVEPTPLALKTVKALRKPVTFEDKVTVSIVGFKHVTVKDEGPGSVTGQRVTQFTLRFTNGSGKPLDLNTVQVLAAYGPQKTKVNTAYVGDAADFAGTIAPGEKKTATYGFELPADGHKRVIITVTFENRRRLAVFDGPLK